MDRYVIKERRPGSEYPQGNQMIAFSASSTIGNNITICVSKGFKDSDQIFPMNTEMYYGACEPSMQPAGSGFANVNANNPRFLPNNMLQLPGQYVSGIDPRYLAAYSTENVASIAVPTVQQVHQEQNILPENITFGSNYQNRNLFTVEKAKPFMQKRYPQRAPVSEIVQHDTKSYNNCGNNRQVTEHQSPQQLIPNAPASTRKQSEVNLVKNEAQRQVRTRSEKLKALHKSGPRAFSGPVEKVLKWHKTLQDIGLLVFYEIVAKCVSVRPGERCAKNIVVRDDNGPAMQVVYYEVDFLLPDLKPPCIIRVIGRMMPGTCRLQAFNVRIATGDDVSTLPRRAAVAAHHVAKLCTEYGTDSQKIVP